MLTFWWFFKRFSLGVVGFLALYVLLSFLLSYVPVGPRNSPAKGARMLYVHSNGIHLDLILPRELVDRELRDQLTASTAAKFLAFGWGDQGFYLDTPTWAELRASVAIRAMFLPSPTAMHVTEYSRRDDRWAQVALTEQQWADLGAYLRSGFRTDATGRISEITGAGYTPYDRFYEGVGNYSCFKTCNTWVNTGMKRIGVRTAIWTPLDVGVLRYLEER